VRHPDSKKSDIMSLEPKPDSRPEAPLANASIEHATEDSDVVRAETAGDADELSAQSPEARRQVAMTWMMIAAGAVALAVFKPELAKTVLAFIVTLSVLVFVHEWGHYQFGRWGGMKINRFGIGFPPWIATKRYKGIDYSIGALPIGGMVDIAGLGSEEEMVSTAKGEGIGAAAPRRNVPHGQKRFQDAALGWRFMTLFAGPLMNFVFAMIVFALVFSLVGVPETKSVNNVVEMVSTGTPADRAGLQSGDRIVGVDGAATNDTLKIRNLIRGSNGKPVSLSIERNGQKIQRSLTPQVEDELQKDGVSTRKGAIIGVMFSSVTEYHRVGLLRGETGFRDSAVGYGLQASYELTSRIFALLRRVVTLRMTADDKRQIGGPLKIAQAVGHTARKSWQETILLAASLSVNLGLMNLLPIPALDGGRIMFILYEAITRRPFDQRKEGFVNAVGMAMVLTFMLFMTFRDALPWIQKGFR
jgi:regulator of sigma E protease